MAMVYPASPVPEISVSPAPHQESLPEPYSPFALVTPKVDSGDSYRPNLLSPVSGHARRASLSPLRPDDVPIKGVGLERERFEALLRASQERNASVGARKAVDLRKQITLRAHKSKQVERRAVFLSKIKAAPCPIATNEPKTPPESPAIFHYSLPSPGLNSPLAMFETLSADGRRDGWIERVDFKVTEMDGGPRTRKLALAPRKPLPSLDQISARLSRASPPVAASRTERAAADSRRLPAFLKKQQEPVAAVAELAKPSRLPGFLKATEAKREPFPTTMDELAFDEQGLIVPPALPLVRSAVAAKPRPALPASVGRLQMPVRASREVCTRSEAPANTEVPSSTQVGTSPAPRLEIKTTVIVESERAPSPDKFSEENLLAFTSRARTAQDMLSTLRRRSHLELASHDKALYMASRPSIGDRTAADSKSWRRWSAPAEMARLERREFAHPVLASPGGF